MPVTKLGETVVHTIGNLPETGTDAPEFTLVANDMKEVSLNAFQGKRVILNVFPSIDTRVCAMSVREFNKRAAAFNNTVVLCISRDLPFAMRRFCGAEGIENVITLSEFRNDDFGKRYGVRLMNGAFEGLLARAVFVINEGGKIAYSELVPVIGQEPNYDKAIEATQA